MSDGTTTRAILERVRHDPADVAARKELIARVYDRLAVVARGLLGPKATQWRPEDTFGLVNEAYPLLEAALADVRPGSVEEFFGFAAHKMRQVLIDLIRKDRGRDGRKKAAPLPDDGGSPSGSGSDDTDWRLDLMDAVERLDDDLRRVVDLRHFHGLTHAEVAEVLGVDERTVKRRWAEALVKLGRRLDPGAAGVSPA
jgi:RNA polymerase sigma factor (sigma-70 family)